MEEKKGSTLLKVSGILMIIGGALALVFAIIAILGVATLVYLSNGELSSGILYASCVLSLIAGVAELVAGIIGVKNWNKPEKAKTCICWGVIVAVLSILGVVLSVVGGGSFSIISLLLGLALPVLYIIGAVRNKA